MRIHVGLPKTFWANAVNTAAYLINKGHSVPLDCGIPEEIQSGKKVDFSFLKLFDCFSYVHIDVATRSKLDSKSKKCFFIGDGGTKFGYHLWDDQNRKIIINKDVIFNEYVIYKDRLGKVSNNADYEVKMHEVVHLKDFLNNNLQVNVCEV